jgi:hypothetical protein
MDLHCAVLALLLFWQEGTTAFVLRSNEINVSWSCIKGGETNRQPNLRALVYPDKTTHPVKIPFQRGLGSQVNSEVAAILLTEVMNYAAVLVDTNSYYSKDFINYAAGCISPSDVSCSQRDVSHPKVHFVLETWPSGIARAKSLPESVRPILTGVMHYHLNEGFFLWPRTIQRAIESTDHLWLDYYRFYDARYYKPHKFFDPLERMLEVVPLNYRVRCTDIVRNDLQESIYFEVSNDTMSCAYNDTVWITPACRANVSECVPFLAQYNFDFYIQVAHAFHIFALLQID